MHYVRLLSFTALFGIFLAPESRAQSTGTVTGRVVDASSGGALPGANVLLAGTSFGTATTADGRFRIANVRPGTYTIRVTYLGYAQAEDEIIVTAGEAIQRNFSLHDEFIETDDIVVIGTLQGQARAYNEQMRAVNIKNVVSSEQLERFPDPNLADALRRVPGVGTEYDRGEAAEVRVRSLPPHLSNVTVNGQRMASSGAEDRSVNIAGISTDVVSSVEVIKALTPDMDADAIAGTVNLITRRPVGDRPIMQAVVAGGFNNNAPDHANFRTAVTYGQRNGALGVLVNATFNRDNRASQDLRLGWGHRDLGNGQQLAMDQFRPSLHEVQRERYGVSGQVDYQLSDRTSFFFRGLLNQYFDREQRHELDMRTGGGVLSGNMITTTGSRAERVTRNYSQNVRLYNLSVGGETGIDDLSIDYAFTYSQGRYDEPYRDYYTFRHATGVGTEYSLNSRELPDFSAPDAYDPSDFRLREFETRLEDLTDRDYIAGINFGLPLQAGDVPLDIRFGAKHYTKQKEREHVRRRFSYSGPVMTMDQFARNIDRRHIGKYSIGPVLDWTKIGTLYQSNPGVWTEDLERTHQNSHGNYYLAREGVSSAYAMSRAEFGDFMVLGGVRMEHTETAYTGNSMTFGEDGNFVGVDPVTENSSHTDFFPMLHLRYRLGLFTNLRLAATTSIARPHFIQLAPVEMIEYSNERITRGNPHLLPLRSMNLDLLGEHYFTSVGVLSGGLFYKEIDNFIYTTAETIRDQNSPFYQWSIRNPENGESATVYGFEVAWQQQFTFLPGALRGLGIYTNYSYTHSEARIQTGNTMRTMRMPLQPPHVFNLALTYNQGGFTGQVAAHFQDKVIYSVEDDEFLGVVYDRFRGGRWQVDVSASQRVMQHLRVFLELNNLSNDVNYDYHGTWSENLYPYRSSYVSWWGNLGVRFDLN